MAIIAVGWGVFTWVVPPYAKNVLGLSPPLIGLLLLANTATVVVAQVPIARLAEGRRRVTMIALAAVSFASACLLVLVASVSAGIAYAALLAASITVGLGECFHTTVLMPLVAELASANLRERYMAAMSLAWRVGLAIAPALGVPALSLSPTATFLAAAAVSLAAAVSALALERRLSNASRFTPRSQGAAATAPPVSH